jgi:DNA-binding SARP family transcriptional activator
LEPELPDQRFASRYLEVSNRQITLHLPPGSSIDLAAFEEAIRQHDWETAEALYRGDFLPEYPYAEWSIALCEHLAEQFHTVLIALAETRLAGGDYTAALNFARRLIARDPWQEQAVLVAMRACQALKDLNSARRYYKRLENTLAKDLGIAPQEELQAFYRSLGARRV